MITIPEVREAEFFLPNTGRNRIKNISTSILPVEDASSYRCSVSGCRHRRYRGYDWCFHHWYEKAQ